MNTPGLFIVGAIVTLIVVTAIVALIYGAVLDGRDQRHVQEGLEPLPEPAPAEREAAAR